MRSYREVPLALLAGAVAGAMVLGIAGRVVTAGVALIFGNALNLSLRGGLEVVIVGTLLGAVGGVLILVLRSVIRYSKLTRGIIVGTILFVCSSLVVWGRGKIAIGLSSIELFTLVVAAIMFIVYGVCADALLTRFKSGGRNRG